MVVKILSAQKEYQEPVTVFELQNAKDGQR